MTPAELNTQMEFLKLSGAALARLTGKHPSTITRFRNGRTPVPPWLAALMDAWHDLQVVTDKLRGRAKK